MPQSNHGSTRRTPEEERKAARERGRELARDESPLPHLQKLIGGYAFAALAENVRDYAIFLMEPTGVICYWGEGARLMKWWSRAEAEGSHLRMLYPENGSEDGTAEAHLEESAATGEYTGEGQRVRGDGSTFWAGVTLTALRDSDGTLLGFAKVTRDMTVRRGAEAALALAWSAHSQRDAAVAEASTTRVALDAATQDTEIALEQLRSARQFASSVLEHETLDLYIERASLLSEMALLNEHISRLPQPPTVRREGTAQAGRRSR